jgi:hypothetical protein
MTGREWTTEPQEAWLKKQFPAFLQADSAAMRKKFFLEIYTAWQKKWPDPLPTTEELTAAGDNLMAATAAKRKAKDKVST